MSPKLKTDDTEFLSEAVREVIINFINKVKKVTAVGASPAKKTPKGTLRHKESNHG